MRPYLAILHRYCRSLALLLLSLLAMSPAAADPAGRVGRIAWLFGSVHLHRAESGESSAALVNWPLTTGDVISTGNNGRVELQVGSSLLQLAGGSVLEFVRLDDQRFVLRLLDGSLIARFRSSEAAREFELETRDGRFQLRDAGRYRFDVDRSSVAGTAYSGAIQFVAQDVALAIGAGQRVQIRNGGRTQYQTSVPLEDEFALWSSGRDRQYGTLAEPRYVSPEMTGAAELDAYGDWHETPAYGAVWFPRALPADWAPYRAGRWAWVEPWGWTWVGDEAWGFAPFHYGRWAYFRGAWGWVPGRRVVRPVYAPALVAWVGSPGGAVPGRAGARPAVGWFPLAPREVYVPAYRSSPRHLRALNSAHLPNTAQLNEVTVAPESVAARTRYTNHRLPQAVTAMPVEAMRQRQHVREAAIRQPDHAELANQPALFRAPVGRDEVRRQIGQTPAEAGRLPRPVAPALPAEQPVPARAAPGRDEVRRQIGQTQAEAGRLPRPVAPALPVEQPVPTRVAPGRDEVRRQIGQMQMEAERGQRPAPSGLPDGQTGRRGDAGFPPHGGAAGWPAATSPTRPPASAPPSGGHASPWQRRNAASRAGSRRMPNAPAAVVTSGRSEPTRETRYAPA